MQNWESEVRWNQAVKAEQGESPYQTLRLYRTALFLSLACNAVLFALVWVILIAAPNRGLPCGLP